jgi:GTP-binding protein HflX
MGIDNGRLMAYLAAHGEVLSRRYHDGNRVTLHCRVPQKYLAVLREDSSVQILERLGGSMAVEEVA